MLGERPPYALYSNTYRTRLEALEGEFFGGAGTH